MSNLPNHLFVSDTDGALYDTRIEGWSSRAPLRAGYARHHGKIKSLAYLKAALRAGGFAWPGGYPIYFILGDGEPASFNAVKREYKRIVSEYLAQYPDKAWLPVAIEINYESVMRCAITNELIEAAYLDSDELTEAERAI